MTDAQVYQLLLAGVPQAQILAAGGNQAQIDAGNARILSAAQVAAQPLAPVNQQNAAVAAGVQALATKIEGEVINSISGLKVSVFSKHFYWFLGAVGVIILMLLFFFWPKGQQVVTASAVPTAVVAPGQATTSNISTIRFDPIKIDVSVTGVLPGKL